MDFCCESLGTTVSASQVSSDGHEVTNLISSCLKTKNAGFIVERFIKPPVDIEFTLPCEVQLNYIHLITSVGSQRSVGIELCSYINVPSINAPNTSENVAQNVFLGKCFVQNEYENQVVFINPSFVNMKPFDSFEQAVVAPVGGIRQVMKLSNWAGVNRASKVKIRLWKTAGGSLASLGKIVINGVPNRKVNPETLVRLINVIKHKQNLQNGNDVKREQSENVRSSKRPSLEAGEVQNGEDVVPEAFYDLITCELMSYPIVLPSGNVIDQTTLDKHVAAEAVWGRNASDPFTGIPFTTERRPVPNMALKSRIDQFLIKNSNVEATIVSGRTIGKRKGEEVNFPNKYAANAHLYRERQLEDEVGSDCNSTNVPQSRHEMELNQSLNNALRSVIGNTSFSSRPSRFNEIFQAPSTCFNCKTATKTTETFYQMPCKHSICRTCIRTESNRCPLCKISFKSTDIHRIHD